MGLQNIDKKMNFNEINEVQTFTVFKGITISFLDLYGTDCKEILQVKHDVVEINYCYKGRYECESENGLFYCIAEGEVAISIKTMIKISSRFPLKMYRGVNMLIDISLLDKEFYSMLNQFYIDAENLQRKWKSVLPCKIFKDSSNFSRIFNEFYKKDSCVDYGYIRLKIIEVLICFDKYELKDIYEYRHFSPKCLEKVKHIREHLEEDIEDELTLAKLAEEHEISEAMIKRCFNAIYGKSPSKYRKEFRMQAASKLLLETDYTIADIAIQVGYQNPSKFSAAFRSVFKTSPFDYKNKNSK